MIFIDLHIYTEENAGSAEELFDKYASNINYVYHLDPGISPVFIQHAAFNQDKVIGNVRMIVLKAPKRRLVYLLRLFITGARFRPAVVMMHGMVEPWYIIIAKMVFGGRVKLMVQNHAEKPAGRLKLLFQKMAGRCTSAFLFVSRAQAEPWIKKRIIKNPEQVFEVMEGSTTFEAKKRSATLNDKTIFIWVGRLDENKDPLTVLKAFSAYVKHNPQAELRMIYHASDLLVQVQNFIIAHSLTGFVTLVGALKHAELEQHYNAADYFILGSHYEGSGYALCEAMACGCVPIVTSIPSFTAMLSQGACGYLFAPGNAAELTEILLGLKPEALPPLRQKVLQKFEDDLSFQGIGRRISHIALQLAAGK